MSTELLPCPFCGGQSYLSPVGNGIWCKGCEVEMHNGEDGIPTAIEQWNTRSATDSELRKAICEATISLRAIGEPGELSPPDANICGVIARSALVRVRNALAGVSWHPWEDWK